MEAGFILIAGIALLVGGIGAMVTRTWLAGILIQRFGSTSARQSADLGIMPWVVLIAGLAIAAFGVTLLVLGWTSIDFICGDPGDGC